MAYGIISGPKRDTLTAQGETLQEAFESNGELANIMRRTERFDGRFKHRKQGKFDYYEYVCRVKLGGTWAYVQKKLSIATEDKQPYISANEPWTLYDKETGTTKVLFDFLTDTMQEVGWTDEATKAWTLAERKDDLWVPA